MPTTARSASTSSTMSTTRSSAPIRRRSPSCSATSPTCPKGLREHWRYPEDMFRAQTEQFTQYHMTDTNDFFRKQFIWDIAPSPEREVAAAAAEHHRSGPGRWSQHDARRGEHADRAALSDDAAPRVRRAGVRAARARSCRAAKRTSSRRSWPRAWTVTTTGSSSPTRYPRRGCAVAGAGGDADRVGPGHQRRHFR